MSGLLPYICVKEPHRKTLILIFLEFQCEVFIHFSLWITDSVNPCQCLAVLSHWEARDSISGENGGAFRPIECVRPTVRGIVIAMYNKRRNAFFR